MTQIFKDQRNQQAFDRDGYVTLPFLNRSEVEYLQKVYDSMNHQFSSGFHVSLFNSDETYKRKVDREIKRITANKHLDFLNHYQTLYTNFMVKEPGLESKMKIHQDWSYLDENKLTSMVIWVPLVDVEIQNGCMYVLKGSHKIKNIVRGPGIACPYDLHHEEIENQYSVPVPLKAGEALIFHHGLVHFSPPNLTDQRRVICHQIMIPEGELVYHWFTDSNDPENKIEKFKTDVDFYMDYTIGNRPSGVESLGFIDYKFDYLKEEEINALNPIISSEAI